jgi:hypothetical protein
MNTNFLQNSLTDVQIDASRTRGSLEGWRQTVGHGGINPVPLPAKVVQGLKKLQPRLIRIFLQEFFDIYPEHGRFDWTRLDPYMDALAQTGASVVAAITMKPPVLFPEVNHAIWRPNDVEEWQQVVAALVQRYSVERQIVAYWEIGNETDIGEWGGSPYLIPGPEDYFEYYCMTIDPILRTCPSVKVGGPASCWIENEPLPGLVRRCRETGTRLDFISWHSYNSDVDRHVQGVRLAETLFAGWPGPRPELLYTEWNKDFEIARGVLNPRTGRMGRNVSVDDMAFDVERAGVTASVLMGLIETSLDWSFYYHIWDQIFYPETFRSFYSDHGLALMMEHWNEMPHRFGLFGVNGEVRPQYFVYQMLTRLGEEKLESHSNHPDVRVLAARQGERIGILLTNYNPYHATDQVVQLNFSNLHSGSRRLVVYRIDTERRWSEEDLELEPVECRDTYVLEDFCFQVALPAGSVVMVRMEEANTSPAAVRSS